jgi:uncharacterized protein with HEPN domain
MRNDLERIKDIQEAIQKIEKYAQRGEQEFFENELIQGWILLQLQIIGEAARAISKETCNQYQNIAWRDIIDFRNLLVHEYFRVDLRIVWRIVDQEISELKFQIQVILDS